jgi:hypothetical protein
MVLITAISIRKITMIKPGTKPTKNTVLKGPCNTKLGICTKVLRPVDLHGQ